MPRAVRWLVIAGLWAGVAALAQTNLLTPSAALQCLTTADGSAIGKPEYPEQELRLGDGGEVRVELVFAAPDAPPQVRLLGDNNFQSLERAVLEHARRLRVPCLPPGSEPARLLQSFVFVPGVRRLVMPTAPRDADEQASERLAACMQRILPGQRPTYPEAALRNLQEGRFMVRLTFASPTSPPQLTFLAGPLHRPLRKAIEDFVQGYRLPCQNGAPAHLNQVYAFKGEGGERYSLRNMSLLQALRSARDLETPVAFDFGAMNCPFELQVAYFRPHAPNVVRELDTSAPARRPLLDWLTRLTLALDEPAASQVLSSNFIISVPCGGLQL